MIDYWLIFSLLKPFVDIIVQTYIENMREDDRNTVLEETTNMAWTNSMEYSKSK